MSEVKKETSENDWKKALTHNPSKCLVCRKEMESVRGLHAHLKKHDLSIQQYYETYLPRKNLLTSEPMAFSSIDTYFETDFSNRRELLEWCQRTDEGIVEEYILHKLEKRIKDKELQFAPCSIQLFIDRLPNIDIFKKFCSSYEEAAGYIGYKPIYSIDFDEKIWKKNYSSQKIWIDTREQKPFRFKKQDYMSLKVGDYCCDAENNMGTVYVDRKSEEDFKGTMTTGFDRFEREIIRAKEFDFHLFVVIESDITKIEQDNLFGPHKYNMKYVFHNMKTLINKYPDTVQFIFAKNRVFAESFTQKLLCVGKKAIRKDLQYFIQKGLIT